MDGAASVVWDSLAFRANIDSLHLTVDQHEWRLARAAGLTFARDGITIDSVDLRSGAVASLTMNAVLPVSAPASGTLIANAFPLGDLGQLLQVTLPLGGDAALRVDLSGTREPQLSSS